MVKQIGIAVLIASTGPMDTATAFARAFFAGDSRAQELMNAPMREAMGPDKSADLRTQLSAQAGAFRSLGPARVETSRDGYTVVRIPAVFAHRTLDLRVSVTADGQIGGFYIVPHEEPPIAQAPQAPSLKGHEVEVEVGRKGNSLSGTLTLPDGQGPFASLVLVHGSGPHDRDETIGPNKPFQDLAAGLAQRGVATLRYEKRSKARPADLAALGTKLTVQQEIIDDAQAALRLLQSRPELDGSRVFVLGHSLGGTCAPRIGTISPKPAGLVILAGTSRPLHQVAIEQLDYIASLPGISEAEREQLRAARAELAELDEALLGRKPMPEGSVFHAPFGYWQDLARHDAAKEAALLGLPVLVLQGGRDYQVTEEDFGRWKRALSGKPGACFAFYPEDDHLFRRGEGKATPASYMSASPMDERVFEAIAQFVNSGRCPSM